MNNRQAVPLALFVVAVVFLIGGLLSVADMIARLSRGSIDIKLGVLGIPIFFGLRRFSAGWRLCALVFVWLGLLSCLGAFATALFLPENTRLKVYSFGPDIRPVWVAIAAVPLFLLYLWQYRVLTKPAIRALFHLSGQQLV